MQKRSKENFTPSIKEHKNISRDERKGKTELNKLPKSSMNLYNDELVVSEDESKEDTMTLSVERHEPKEHSVSHEYFDLDQRFDNRSNLNQCDHFPTDQVNIKFVDKFNLHHKNDSSNSETSEHVKVRKSHQEDNINFTSEKKGRQRKLAKLLVPHNQKSSQKGSEYIYEDNCNSSVGHTGLLPDTNGFSSNLKKELWNTRSLKVDEVSFSDDATNEKLPINLSLKIEHGTISSLTPEAEFSSEIRGSNSSTSETPKSQSTPLASTIDRKVSKSQQDTSKHFSNPESSELSSTIAKISEKSSKDDFSGSENDLIRDDPVCIYCYKKLPKDISNIIEHCRLCVYMLRPINIKYMCYMCLYNTHCRTGIKRHIMRHLNIRPYTCSICPFSGIVSRSLKLHMKTHSMEQLLSLSEEKKSHNLSQNSTELSDFTDDTFDHESIGGVNENSFSCIKTFDTTSGLSEKNIEDKTNTEQQDNFRERQTDPIQLTIVHKIDPTVGLISDHLFETMSVYASDMEQESVHNDSNNNVNNNAAHAYDKLDTERVTKDKVSINAIDLTNNQSNLDTHISTLRDFSRTGYSVYGNEANFNTFDEVSLKRKSFSDCLMFNRQERVDNGALDYCLKKST